MKNQLQILKYMLEMQSLAWMVMASLLSASAGYAQHIVTGKVAGLNGEALTGVYAEVNAYAGVQEASSTHDLMIAHMRGDPLAPVWNENTDNWGDPSLSDARRNPVKIVDALGENLWNHNKFIAGASGSLSQLNEEGRPDRTS